VIHAIRKTRPDIVFLDIEMPGENGLEILKQLTECKIHDKVWIISGDDEQSTIEKAHDYGARGFIRKPFTLDNLNKVFTLYNKITKDQNNDSLSDFTKVMLADDEPLMQELLEQVLIDNQCIVEAKASSGKEIIGILDGGWVPEMTFLDIEMPNGNGMVVLKHIKTNDIPTFTVMVSAHGTFDNVKTAMDAGADGFIVKPYSEKKIEQIISKYKKSKSG
jgi:two-component system chemotaxis response regulator CheY